MWRIGRGRHALNPLDAGPLGAALHAAVGTERDRIAETIRARRQSLLEALLSIVRRSEVTVTERRLLAAALDLAAAPRAVPPDPSACPDLAASSDLATGAQPVIPDVLRVLESGVDPLPRLTGAADDLDYRRLTRELVNTLGLLCEGPIRGLFDRASTVTAQPDTPALSLDISALDDDDDDVVAAAMLCSWTWSANLIDATTSLTPDHTRSEPGSPSGRRNVVQVQDELWRALRVAPGLVERSDRITRLGRHRGIVSFQITHSLDDLEALPTEADRAKARGMAARNADPAARRDGRRRTRRATPDHPAHRQRSRPDHLLGRAPHLARRAHPPRPRQIPDQIRGTPRPARRPAAHPDRAAALRHRPRLPPPPDHQRPAHPGGPA